ncbi:rap1 GTPase-activating protein 1-like isoform X1, partial [Vespula squamosa]
MESDPSSSVDNSKDSDSCVLRKKEKMSLKLHLTRVFNSNALRSPKSPSGSFDSQRLSPNRCMSPVVKPRHSWHIHTFKNKGSTSSRSSESGISLSSSIKSSTNETFLDSPGMSPNSPKNCYSPVWDVKTGKILKAGNIVDYRLLGYRRKTFIASLTGQPAAVAAAVAADISCCMKYSPQQQQQKERKSESEIGSVELTPSREANQRSSMASMDNPKNNGSSSSSSLARRTICRSPSSGMFAWMPAAVAAAAIAAIAAAAAAAAAATAAAAAAIIVSRYTLCHDPIEFLG